MRTLSLLLVIFILGFSTAQAQESGVYRATITNLTYGQMLTPPALVVHDETVSIYTLGEEASEGLKALAKEGVSSFLETELNAVPGVWNFVSGSEVIFPKGISTEIYFWGTPTAVLSLVSMLGSTNDAFIGGSKLSLDLQPGEESTTLLHVYDAGAEENIETCEYLPGDPCTSHGGETPINEGFVHFHPGLVYNGVLDRLHHSFPSISAKITIMRME